MILCWKSTCTCASVLMAVNACAEQVAKCLNTLRVFEATPITIMLSQTSVIELFEH